MTETPYALVVGEALVDIVQRAGEEPREIAGGSQANAAVALARLGRPTWLATCFGDDERGGVLAAHLADNDVRLAGDPHVVGRTATAAATIGSDGAASYEFDIEWRPSAIDRLPAQPPEVVLCGSIGAVLEPGADDVVAMLERMAGLTTVSYDLNVRPAVTGTGDHLRERVLAVLVRAALVKASDEDLETLWPDTPLAEVVERFLGVGVSAVVVTRGPDGATWFGPEATLDVAIAPGEVVDTIGAGDTFIAATVDALWARGLLGAEGPARLRAAGAEVWAEVLEHAARAAAVTVSRPGADPPRRAELLD